MRRGVMDAITIYGNISFVVRISSTVVTDLEKPLHAGCYGAAFCVDMQWEDLVLMSTS